MAVEMESFRNLAPKFVELVLFASTRFDRSWEKIANPLKCAYRESGDCKNHPEKLDEHGVKELLQQHSNARTTILDRCANGEFNKQLLWMIPVDPSASLRLKRASIPGMLPVTLPDTPTVIKPRRTTRVEVLPIERSELIKLAIRKKSETMMLWLWEGR